MSACQISMLYEEMIDSAQLILNKLLSWFPVCLVLHSSCSNAPLIGTMTLVFSTIRCCASCEMVDKILKDALRVFLVHFLLYVYKMILIAAQWL